MKLTHKEHKARAMLMGRVYDWRDGTYCKELAGSGLSSLDLHNMLCCETLEHISPKEANDRREKIGPSFWRINEPDTPTPWERADDE